MNKVLAFVLGATAGSLVTWRLVVEKYKRLADEEIASVVEYYTNKEKNREIEKELEEDTDEEENDKDEYEEKLKELGYIPEDGVVEVDPGEDYIEPYVLAPEEFGELDYYDKKSWTYYADFVLTDETGEIVCEPEKVIGDALEHFGEYEEDCVHVRNENIECDIEILKHEMTFSEINKEDI